MAAKVDVDRTTVSRWEMGRNRPQPQQLRRARESGDGVLAAHALGCMSALHSGIPKGGGGGDPNKAIAILDVALKAGGAHAPAPMRSWVFARRAEEHAIAVEHSARIWLSTTGCVGRPAG